MKHFRGTFDVRFTSFKQPSSYSSLDLLNFGNFVSLNMIFLFYLMNVLLLTTDTFTFILYFPWLQPFCLIIHALNRVSPLKRSFHFYKFMKWNLLFNSFVNGLFQWKVSKETFCNWNVVVLKSYSESVHILIFFILGFWRQVSSVLDKDLDSFFVAFWSSDVKGIIFGIFNT